MRGGKRDGAGRKPKPVIPEPAFESQGTKPTAGDREWAGRTVDALNKPEEASDSYEVKRLRVLSEAQDLRIRLDFTRWLYDKRDGKATQPIDHGGNLDHTIIFDMPGPERERKK